MNNSVNIGIAGLGTVGQGVFKILTEKAALIKKRSGKEIKIVAVSARDSGKKRGIEIGNDITWYKKAQDLAEHPDIDIIVELIGGADGVAYDLAKKTLSGGKSFITANKALIATHGKELASMAEKHQAALVFEAAVAGGIPILKALREGLSANEFTRVAGIMNGTCNYILTSMMQEKREFEDVLNEAQELGYAEADPTFDIDGIDTAHKLAIITALVFSCPPDLEHMHVEGIRNVSLVDIEYAAALGYHVKLLGITRISDKGIEQRVHPSLVHKDDALAKVDGVLNAVAADCDNAGQIFFEGAGAGERPTASSVVADIVDVVAGRNAPPFGVPVKELQTARFLPIEERKGGYYIRVRVKDEPGVLASITSHFSKQSIGVEDALQKAERDNSSAQIALTTHETTEKAINKALTNIQKMGYILDGPHVLRIVSTA